MKKAKLIYNPVSGDGGFKHHLDAVVDIFQERGYLVELNRTSKNTNLGDFFKAPIDEANTIIIAAGGDGTVSQVVNRMMDKKISAPLGIIPVGTANDLASFLGMSKDIHECCHIILEKNVEQIDVGRVNKEYFISVVSGGLVAKVPQSTDLKLKNTLGKMAYYLKGLEEIPTFKPISISLNSPAYQYNGDLLFFLILNGQFAGGFKRIAPKALLNDGLFDVILFKNMSLPVLARLFVKLLRGEHIHDPNVIFFQTDQLEISPYKNNESPINSDIDGDAGPDLPLVIKNYHRALNIIVPKKGG